MGKFALKESISQHVLVSLLSVCDVSRTSVRETLVNRLNFEEACKIYACEVSGHFLCARAQGLALAIALILQTPLIFHHFSL